MFPFPAKYDILQWYSFFSARRTLCGRKILPKGSDDMEIYRLTNETIDMLSGLVGEMYETNGASRRDALRARLFLEESLLKYQNKFGKEIEVYFRTYRVFAQTRLCIRLRCPSFDPFTLEDNPMAFMIKSITSAMVGAMPTWRFRNMENEIVFTLRKQTGRDNLTKLLAPLCLGLLLGLAALTFLPPEGLSRFVTDYLEPLSNAYAGLFCVMAVVMTLCGFTLSIVHTGDMASVGAMGGHVLRRFYSMTVLIILPLTAIILPFFDLNGGTLTLAAKSIYDVLIGFIPTGFVAPFLDFNSFHILIIGLMFGFCLLALGQKGETLVRLFDECNMVAVMTNNFLNRFIGIYAGLRLFAIITTSEFSHMGGTGRMILAILGGELLIFVFYTAYACLKTKTPLRSYLRTMIPPFIVCLTSASLGTAYSSIAEADLALGVDEDTFNLSSNLGFVVFQPACTLMFVFSSLYMAQSYGVEISLVWVLLSVLLSVILIAAVPNIPGAAVSVFPLLFTQLGLPAEALTTMIAVNALLQFITTAVDGWCLQAEILCFYHDEKKRIKA